MSEMAIPAPLIISSRLMAAYVIEGVGKLHIMPLERDSEGKIVYRYVIEDNEGNELLDAQDLWSGAGNDVMLLDTLDNLLGFLGAAGEAYASRMAGRESENGDLFPPNVMAWAHEYSDELAMAQFNLTLSPE